MHYIGKYKGHFSTIRKNPFILVTVSRLIKFIFKSGESDLPAVNFSLRYIRSSYSYVFKRKTILKYLRKIWILLVANCSFETILGNDLATLLFQNAFMSLVVTYLLNPETAFVHVLPNRCSYKFCMKAWTFIKKKLQHKCFLVNFAIFPEHLFTGHLRKNAYKAQTKNNEIFYNISVVKFVKIKWFQRFVGFRKWTNFRDIRAFSRVSQK